MTATELAPGDVQAIRDVLARYWRGIDRCEIELVRAAYHSDAYDDHGYYKGSVDGFLATLPAEIWPAFAQTQHIGGHTLVERLDADTALVESYAEAHHVRVHDDGSAHDHVFGLRYVDRFERRKEEWRIARRVCAWDWRRVHRTIADPRGRGGVVGARDRTDPVFTHPSGDGRIIDDAALVAKHACRDAVMRAARGIDRCEPDTLRSAFHADATLALGDYTGDLDGYLAHVAATVADATTCSEHLVANVLVAVRGDVAHGESYGVEHLAVGEGTDPVLSTCGVRYLDRFERRDGAWRIASRVRSVEWAREHVPQWEFPAAWTRGARDGSELRYGVLPLGGSLAEQVATIADREAVHAALLRYSRAVDRCDEDLLRSVYHHDAHDDHSLYVGDVDGFVAFVKAKVQDKNRCTEHKLANLLVDIDGDVARAETYALGHHVRDRDGVDVDDVVMGIRYLDTLERRDGEWRLADRLLRFEWQAVEPLRPLDPAWTLGRHDTTDEVYR